MTLSRLCTHDLFKLFKFSMIKLTVKIVEETELIITLAVNMSQLQQEIEEQLKTISKNLSLTACKLQIQSSFQKGNGFISDPYHAVLQHENGKLDFIIKVSPRDELYRKQLFIHEVYLCEIYFYEYIIKYFDEFQKKCNVAVYHPFPKCYSTVKDDAREILVLENLKPLGYNMLQNQVDEDTFCLILSEYAKFHALSIGIKLKDKEGFDKLCEGLYKGLNRFNVESGVTQSIHEQCEHLEKLFQGEDDVAYLEKLRSFRGRLGAIMNSYEYYHDEYSIIIHGDSRSNNILVKYDESSQAKLCFIDFQVSRLGSLIQDLSYLFYTCCGKDKFLKLNRYLEIYYNVLSGEVQRLGCNLRTFLTFDELKNQWKKYSCFGLAMTVVVLHSMYAESHEFPDVDKVLKSGEKFFVALNFISVNERVYEEKIRDVIVHFVDNDFI